MPNPYEATVTTPPAASPRWLRRLIVLNLVLLSVPFLILLASFAWLQVELFVAAYSQVGDPVTYQHFYWVTGPSLSWSLVAYLLIPNLIFLVAYLTNMTNPYSSPPSVSDAEAELDPVIEAKARLSRPATALIIMASIQSVFVAIYLFSAVFVVSRGGMVADDFVGIGIGCLQFVCLVLIAVGGAKMGFLESLPMARLGATLACIPFITPFVIIGIPFGVWSLRLLSDPKIKASFFSERASA